jgi:hypothetical protein
MSDTGLTVPGMTEPPRRYDVAITVDQDGGYQSNPAEFVVAAQQAASARAARADPRVGGRPWRLGLWTIGDRSKNRCPSWYRRLRRRAG